MHETVEEIQVKSRKIIEGYFNVYLVLSSFILIYVFNKPQIFLLAFLIFSALSFYSAGFEYLRFIKATFYFTIPGLFVIAVLTPGEKLIWLVSREGLERAFITFLRAYSSFSLMLYLIFTTGIPELLSALKKMKLPEFVVEIMALIYRSIQIFIDEVMRLERSADSRLGFFGKKNFVKTSALIGYSMFLRSMERVEKLNMAMESRCYSGKMPAVTEKNRGLAYTIAILSAIVFSGVVF